jgi:hypothetical protein
MRVLAAAVLSLSLAVVIAIAVPNSPSDTFEWGAPSTVSIHVR